MRGNIRRVGIRGTGNIVLGRGVEASHGADISVLPRSPPFALSSTARTWPVRRLMVTTRPFTSGEASILDK